MSHITSARVMFSDPERVKKAVASLIAADKIKGNHGGANLGVVTNVPCKGYFGTLTEKCDVAITVDGTPRVGFSNLTVNGGMAGKVVGDVWYIQDDDNFTRLQDNVSKQYAIEGVHDFAREYEWEVQSTQEQGEKVVITLSQEDYVF